MHPRRARDLLHEEVVWRRVSLKATYEQISAATGLSLSTIKMILVPGARTAHNERCKTWHQRRRMKLKGSANENATV